MKNFLCGICQSYHCEELVDPKNIRFSCYGFDKKIVKCSDCSTIQLFPRWSKNELKRLYSTYSSLKNFDGQKEPKNIYKSLKWFLKGKKRILEIGCSRGNNLFYWRKKGYNVVGIDADPSVSYKDIITNCNIEDHNGFEEYDFVYGMHVLEHVDNPFLFIEKVVKLLKKNGTFLFEIPNVEDPLLSVYKNSQYDKFYWYPFHLYFYNKQTVEKVLNGNSNIEFKVFLKQRYGIINHLRWALLGRPGNINFKIPLADKLYSFFLKKVLKKSDTLVIIGKKRK